MASWTLLLNYAWYSLPIGAFLHGENLVTYFPITLLVFKFWGQDFDNILSLTFNLKKCKKIISKIWHFYQYIVSASNWKNMSVHTVGHSNSQSLHESDVSRQPIACRLSCKQEEAEIFRLWQSGSQSGLKNQLISNPIVHFMPISSYK